MRATRLITDNMNFGLLNPPSLSDIEVMIRFFQ